MTLKAMLAGELNALEQERADTLSAAEVPGSSGISWESQEWMALAPYWTIPAARTAGFPTGDLTLDSLFARMVEQDLCTSVPGRKALSDEIDEDGRRHYVEVPSIYSARQPFSEAVVRRLSADRLRHALAIIGNALGLLHSEDRLGCWGRLASFAEHSGSAQVLNDEVNNCVATARLDQAACWIDAAEALQSVVGRELDIPLRLARNRVELAKRRVYDEGMLRDFLERPRQIEAFHNFLLGPVSQWGLHYAGPGGVGKTSLLRFLQNRVLAHATTARVDFDNLSPSYPSRAPGLLLMGLAEDLVLSDRTGIARKLFHRFQQDVMGLHERISADRQVTPVTELLLQDPQFKQLLSVFAEALRALPRPVVLMLDTCEELAKLQADGTVPESVAATFQIFKELQAEFPELRVVFSGRRPLASSGPGWSVVSNHPARGLPARDYLRLFVIEGFDRGEAEKYLAKSEGMKPELRELILQRSPAPEMTPTYDYSYAAGERYNPFELFLFRRWAEDDPTIETTLRDPAVRDPYVELRIIRRLGQVDIRELLPAAALLRRFTQETLGAVLSTTDPARRRSGIEELSQQEWIGHEWPNLMLMSRQMSERLLRVLRQADSGGVERVARRCIEHLEKITLGTDLEQIETVWFESLLRLLADQPQEMADWWRRFEERIRVSQRWGVVDMLCQRLLAEDPPAAPARHIRAAIAATWAAALAHRSTYSEPAWNIVAIEAGAYPDDAVAAELGSRAIAGRISGKITTTSPIRVSEAGEFRKVVESLIPNPVGEQLAASLTAALETLVERAEVDPVERTYLSSTLARQVQSLCRNTSIPLRAFVQSLVGRTLIMEKSGASGRDIMPDGVRVLPDPGPPSPAAPAEPWMDWVAPDDLESRLVLERIRARYGCVETPEDLAKSGLKRGVIPQNADQDRLASATLALQQAGKPEVKRRWRNLAGGSPSPVLVSPRRVHLHFAPFWATYAEALACSGRADEALARLREHSGMAESTAVSFEDVLVVDRACARIGQMMRLLDGSDLSLSALRTSILVEDKALLWELQALGARTTEVRLAQESTALLQADRGRGMHALWSVTEAVALEPGEEAFKWAVLLEARTPGDDGPHSMALRLDRAELSMLRGDFAPRPEMTIPWLEQWQDYPFELCTAILRSAVLAGQSPYRHAGFDTLVKRIGLRKVAMMARREGDLLSLRLPEAALRMLRFARDCFHKVEDPVGELLTQACLAVTSCAVRRPDVATQAEIPRLKDAHAAARKAVESSTPAWTDIPSWDDIEDAAEAAANSDDERLRRAIVRLETPTVPAEGVRAVAWCPWALRMAACWWRYLTGGKRGRQTFVDAVFRSYSITTQLAVDLPRDFRVIFRDSPEVHHAEQSRRADGSRPGPLNVQVSCAVTVPAPLSSLPVTLIAGGIRTETTLPELASYSSMRTLFLDSLQSVARGGDSVEALRHGQEILLHVDHAVSWAPWEAMLTPLISTRAWRTVEGARVRQQDPVFTAGSVRILTVDRPNRRFAFDVWRGAVTRDEPVSASSGEAWLAASPDPHVRILHVQATAVQVSGGVRLNLTPGEDLESVSRNQLARSSDLLNLAPDAAVCILQSLVSEGERSTYERSQASYLRTFAAELFALGVPAVIVFPPLGPRLWEPHLAKLAKALLTIGNTVDHLQSVLTNLRSDLATLGEEVVWDLNLYAKPPSK